MSSFSISFGKNAKITTSKPAHNNNALARCVCRHVAKLIVKVSTLLFAIFGFRAFCQLIELVFCNVEKRRTYIRICRSLFALTPPFLSPSSFLSSFSDDKLFTIEWIFGWVFIYVVHLCRNECQKRSAEIKREKKKLRNNEMIMLGD